MVECSLMNKVVVVRIQLESLKFYLGLSGKKIEEKCSKEEVLYSDIFSHC